MADISCLDCGAKLKPDDISCPNCGSKNRFIKDEDGGVGTENAFVVVIDEGIGIQAKADINVRNKLNKDERKLWDIFKSQLSKVTIDSFELGFPSGIKVIFKIQHKQ